MHLYKSYPTDETPDVSKIPEQGNFSVSGRGNGPSTTQLQLKDNESISFFTPVKTDPETGKIEPVLKSNNGEPISQTVLIQRDNNKDRVQSLV